MPHPIPELYAKIANIRAANQKQGRTKSGQVALERLLGGEYTPDEIRTALRAVQKAEAHGLPADTRYTVGDDGQDHYVIPQRPGEACTSDDAEAHAEQYLALLDAQGRVPEPEPVVVPELSLVDQIRALFVEADMSGRARLGRNALATLLGASRRQTDKALAEIAAESAPPVATGELAAVRFDSTIKPDRADELSPLSDARSPFDAVRRVRADGSEYWTGRDLMPLMAYTNWRNFAEVVECAKMSGRNTGMDVTASFTGIDQAGFITGHSPYDYHLSREAAYLVAMNGDPRKPEVAAAQGYFVVQTVRAEVELPAAVPSPVPQSGSGLARVAGMMRIMLDEVVALETRVTALEGMTPVLKRLDRWLTSGDTVYVEEWAKSLGKTEKWAFEALRKTGVLFKDKDPDGRTFNLPMASWARYFVVVDEHKNNMHFKTSKITAEGQVALKAHLEKHGYELS